MPKLIIWEFLSSQGTHPPLHYHNDQKPPPKDEHYREIQHIRPSPLFVPFLKSMHSMPVISLPFFKNLLIINNGRTIAPPYTRRVFSRPGDNQHWGDAFPGGLLTEKWKNEIARGREGGRRSLIECLQLLGKVGPQTRFHRGDKSLIRSQI